MLYSLIYKYYFSLRNKKRTDIESGKKFPPVYQKLLDYCEWYYNIPLAKAFSRHPSKELGINVNQKRTKKIIVSLTSYPKRINTLWLSIETLLRQSLKPDMIILWLAKEQFNDIEALPIKLQALQERGLTIRFCDDVKSHKKYLYAMQEYPDDIIILVDDDSFYPLDTIEKLYEMYQKNPAEISCMTPTLISDFYDMPSKWNRPCECSEVTHSYLAQPYTGQGTLFPPHCLDEKYAYEKDLIMRLCPFADDLWLKYMSLRKGTRVSTYREMRDLPVTIYGTQNSSLWYINGQDGKNDVQWQNLLNYFNDDFSSLKAFKA